MTDFKVGDKVKYVGKCTGWGGRVATVTEANRIAELGGAFDYLIADAQSDLLAAASELKLVKPEPKFKVGDFVTFAEPDNDHWQGGKAEVIEGGGHGRFTARVRIIEGPPKNSLYRDNYGAQVNFDPAHLKLWEAPKPEFKQEFGTFLPDYAAFDAALTSNLFASGGAPAFAKGGKVTEPVNQESSKPEAVKHPAHYGGDTTYEAIKVIEAWGLGFNLGNAAKYLARAGKKGNKVEDLNKLIQYVQFEIAKEEAK